MMETLLSFDLQADFGFLRKPDVNEGISLTYNMLHRPALLGILGAIAGLAGYARKGEWPEYWHKLGHLRVGVAPLAYLGDEEVRGNRPRHERGSFARTVVQYVNATGFASGEAGGVWVLNENTLRRPAYRCYVLLNRANPVESLLYERLRAQEAEYVPYLGKNEHPVSWSAASVREYSVSRFEGDADFQVLTAFWKGERVRDQTAASLIDPFDFSVPLTPDNFWYFERLPVGFDLTLRQYAYADFAYTNALFKRTLQLPGLYRLEGDDMVQLH